MWTKKQRKEYMQEYRKRPDVILRKKIENVKYAQTHKEQAKKRYKKYYQLNKEKVKKQAKTWIKNHPEQTREIWIKHQHKRRGLGFISLNEPFADLEAHHIDKNFVIYIPEELHTSIWHNVWTGEGMTEINNKVYEWLGYIPLL
jgi:hypothetical protein